MPTRLPSSAAGSVNPALLQGKHYDRELAIPGGDVGQRQVLRAGQNHLIAATYRERNLAGSYQLEKVGLETVLELDVQTLVGEEALFLGNVERRKLHAGNVAQAQRHLFRLASRGRFGR